MDNKQAIQGFAEFFKGITGNQNLEIPSEIAEKCGIQAQADVLDKIRAEILEEKECAYADFDKYKVDYLGVDSRYVEDELPYDDFRYGMERCIEILDKYRNEVSE